MQNQFEQRMQMSLLLREIDDCRTVGEIIELLKREHIAVPTDSQNEEISLESLRFQARKATVEMFYPDVKVQTKADQEEKDDRADETPGNEEKQELIAAVDACPTIDKLFELVKERHIVIRMKSQNAASNIPFEPLPENPAISPLETLRSRVREAVEAMFRSDDKQDLINAVKTCPTIDKLFELVRDRHIVIQMKSQNSASCLPQKQFSPEELTPDTSPLERLRQQVLEAILYG